MSYDKTETAIPTGIALSWTPEGKTEERKTTWRRTVEREREEQCWMAYIGCGKSCCRQ